MCLANKQFVDKKKKKQKQARRTAMDRFQRGNSGYRE